MPRKVKEEPVVEIVDDEVSESKAGIVMIDGEYYFKIVQRQYVFGKKRIKEDGTEVYQDKLYPSTIEVVFNLYFKELLVNKTVGKTLTVEQLLDTVKEIKADIALISDRLSL